MSPILANIYLHYTLDLWFERVVRKYCRREAYIVRYCDDFVCCFQYKIDAERFYLALIQRLKKFNLEIAEERTKIIEFGRFACTQCKKYGKTKPETFDFLGFTHYCSQGRNGQFRVKRKTSRKKFKASLLRIKEWIKIRRNWLIKYLMDELKVKLNGYYRYYGITDNSSMIDAFYYKTNLILFKWLNRRSHRKSFGWDKFNLFLQRHPIPKPKIYINIYHKKAGFGYVGK
ncbi:RNA-directed DNA polymerase (reverse transcriptase) [Desulfofarcimen acetoxidans DSM 771]|uniref:RNA-directed DNA polymerase (Reverse transcriptase) n=1 Tax=Desulfofarcimen acetoxidans (strain ATCC 49208 / DSM 771 / KCTC 5769 / VKM B-1644 / 5575) TaxID=485916 RepID=C8VWD0_DESAS|nr:reverse transcriptase domain-containing protein [Desulfofarcimen acetoxidans]ACV62482.1 RNA-directed DNA polymerase (reverse transcriptase) [Desulfofarcimen acetoxidans DSM 771]